MCVVERADDRSAKTRRGDRGRILKNLLFGRLGGAEPLLQVSLDPKVVADVTPKLIDLYPALEKYRVELRSRARADIGDVSIDIRFRRIRRGITIDLRRASAAARSGCRAPPMRDPERPRREPARAASPLRRRTAG